MLNVPIGHFTEAAAVWCGCVLLFILVIALKRARVHQARAARAAGRASKGAALDLSGEGPAGDRPLE